MHDLAVVSLAVSSLPEPSLRESLSHSSELTSELQVNVAPVTDIFLDPMTIPVHLSAFAALPRSQAPALPHVSSWSSLHLPCFAAVWLLQSCQATRADTPRRTILLFTTYL